MLVYNLSNATVNSLQSTQERLLRRKEPRSLERSVGRFCRRQPEFLYTFLCHLKAWREQHLARTNAVETSYPSILCCPSHKPTKPNQLCYSCAIVHADPLRVTRVANTEISLQPETKKQLTDEANLDNTSERNFTMNAIRLSVLGRRLPPRRFHRAHWEDELLRETYKTTTITLAPNLAPTRLYAHMRRCDCWLVGFVQDSKFQFKSRVV